MNTLLLVAICFVFLVIGYRFYGSWLDKQWGVNDSASDSTPAHAMKDDVDYVPAKAPILMGHHFSSIAGAGPITGPIAASIFGWLPVAIWVVVGGIFFGGVHDYGALYASIKHKGQSVGEIISANMSRRAKRLFLTFAYLTLLLVVAAFASIVAGTFGATFDESGAVDVAKSATNSSVATVSLLFIAIAIVFGFFVTNRGVPMGVASILGIGAIVAIMYVGMHWHPVYISSTTWMYLIGGYITIASIAPVWILLQPRDYLSSFLLYAMLAVALVGVVGAHPDINPAALPAFAGFEVNGSSLFPILFTTVACGAISGFHSLVSSGTTSKQLDRVRDAKPIAYGGMLLECALAILTVCAVAFYRDKIAATGGTPAQIFAGGIAGMVAAIPGFEGLETILVTLLVLTYSAFCLTSLDTATRLARFMFQEFFLEKGETPATVTDPARKFLVNPLVATVITVIAGIGLGMNGYGKIWGLFGAANQLLAGLGLLAVASWLGNIGRNNKMFLFPMAFMMVATISSLYITIKNQIGTISAGGADWGAYAQAILGSLLVLLAIVLVIEGVQTLFSKRRTA